VSFYLPPRPKTFKFLGVAGGTIERSCYSPHLVKFERDYQTMNTNTTFRNIQDKKESLYILIALFLAV
jgi:hypothetical protein